MAAHLDGQKASARKELDRLHRNIVVDLDRRLVSAAALPGAGDLEPDEPELDEAVHIVERTARALQALKDAANRKDVLIADSTLRIQTLESELHAATAERAEFVDQLDVATEQVEQLAADKEALEGKLEAIEQECGQLAAQLKRLTQLIKTSLDTVNISA